MVEFVPVAPQPSSGHQWKELIHPLDLHHLNKHCQGDPSQFSPFQTEHSQVSQPLLKEMLQSPNDVCGFLFDSLQQFPVLLQMCSPEVDTMLQV